MAKERSYEGPYSGSKALKDLTWDPTTDGPNGAGNSVERKRELPIDSLHIQPGSKPLPVPEV
jgi:hypothetical protein